MMTTRPRTAGLDAIRRLSLRPYYEQFTPKVEERDEDGTHFLQLELPDFNVQQVRVKVEEATRTVAVTGDRYVGNNKWFRLDKTYPLPQNCIIHKISHEFHDGILTISIPKEPIKPAPENGTETRPDPKPESKEPEKAPLEDDSKTPSLKKPTNGDTGSENTRPDPKPETKEPEKAALENDSRTSSPEKPTNGDTGSENTRPDPKPETKEPEKAPLDSKTSTLEKPTNDDTDRQKTRPDPKQDDSKENPPLMPKQEASSDETKKAEDQKIGSSDQKLTEKEEIKEQKPEKKKENEKEKTKESEREKVSKDREKPLTNTQPRTSRGIRALKPTVGFAIGKLPLPLKAYLAAAIVIVAAYFAYTYYQLPAN